jgi:hypothetical protein
MIQINRSEAFWRPITEHPAIKHHLDLGTGVDWLPTVLASDDVLPLASSHGGYFLHRLDPYGHLWDLHAAFSPEGWGRVANATLKAALLFLPAWQLVTASEVGGNWRSRPPKSFGFRPAGPLEGWSRTWFLTRSAWEASPARRRME